MKSNKKINIVLFGIGNVGNTVIKQINANKEYLRLSRNIEIELVIIANSQYAFFASDTIDNRWEIDFSRQAIPYTIDSIFGFVAKKKLENLIAIDATASEDFVKNYIPLVKNGFHIVSANKIANTLHSEFYEELRRVLLKKHKFFLYETNVGAGLPIIETVKSLYESGENIQKIRGVFSGSLSYIFNRFSEGGVPFSQVLDEASKKGLTEPDAREDLSGKDVARKLLILARELKLKKELGDISVESLVPESLNGKTSLREFQGRASELDPIFDSYRKTNGTNTVLRFVGELDVKNETLDVKLVREAKSSPIGQLQGADAVFEIYTESYGEFPLVIRGAGAGKEVTARGVLSDVLKLTAFLN